MLGLGSLLGQLEFGAVLSLQAEGLELAEFPQAVVAVESALLAAGAEVRAVSL